MKRKLTLLLALTLVITTIGCGTDTKEPQEPNSKVESEKESIVDTEDNTSEEEDSKKDYKILEGSIISIVTTTKEELEAQYGSYAPVFKDFDKKQSFSLYGKTFNENFTLQDILNGLYLSEDGYKYSSVEEFINASHVLGMNSNDIHISTEPKEDKNFFDEIRFSGVEKDKGIDAKESYENNRWCYVVSYSSKAAEVLSIEDKNIFKNAYSAIFNFGTPDEVVLLSDSINSYFECNEETRVNQNQVGMVYKFDNFTMIAVFLETSIDGSDSCNTSEFAYIFTSNEMYEKYFDSMYFLTNKGKVLLWTKENGIAF